MLSDQDRAHLAHLAQVASDAERAHLDALAARDDAARAALADGASPGELASVLGVNRSRVYQIRDARPATSRR